MQCNVAQVKTDKCFTSTRFLN